MESNKTRSLVVLRANKSYGIYCPVYRFISIPILIEFKFSIAKSTALHAVEGIPLNFPPLSEQKELFILKLRYTRIHHLFLSFVESFR